ncbi:MAG TPA: DUF2779 domain-containing protein [Spirochaetota bacterium]|nr:DUF2779 domain-containing protein [Spirochaetota bacterium]HQO21613.1 DUF2779 domain-containing protein [Spirochaetota bacterium]HQQ22697.1 DUF2779 domain-containing protein [Spirochaetota bacterium]
MGLECPTKLFYTGKTDIYPNRKAEDEFLIFLADGGFQVGKLAQCYYPYGVEIEEKDHFEAVEKTYELLKTLDDVTIFEAAIQFENLFIRVDILVKKGNQIDLIEVKAKLMNPEDPSKSFVSKNEIRSSWVEYLYDIAFQRYVFCKAFPKYETVTKAFLMLVDKSMKSTVEGLNQRFYIDSNRKVVTKGGITPEDLGSAILTAIPVDDCIDIIYQSDCKKRTDYTFDEFVKYFSIHYLEDRKIKPELMSHCRTCEFKALPEEEESGQISGYKECWKESGKFTDDDFLRPLIIDLWNFRGKDKYIKSGKYFLSDIPDDNIFSENSRMRQKLQIDVCTGKLPETYLNISNIRDEVNGWKYPLHFIDFETMRVAVPFFKNETPYSQIAFQFSHHIIDENGVIRHAGEWINTELGFYPNFEFVRKLKDQLDKDDGTIFRYAMHENTVLSEIANQLKNSYESDKDVLIEWIKTITVNGKRSMVDLLDVVKRNYYHISMKGSNSLKAVLPAILQGSEYLQNKYNKPIYGTYELISLNYNNKKWIELDINGKVINPYYSLRPAIEEIEDAGLRNTLLNDIIIDEDFTVKEGGTAMSAYSKMQFCECSEQERIGIAKALLKYCELDTFAMVLLYEYFKHEIA